MEWHNPITASPEIMLKMHKAEIERRMIQAARLSEISGERSEGWIITVTKASVLRLTHLIGLFQQLSAPISLHSEPKLATSTGEIRAVK